MLGAVIFDRVTMRQLASEASEMSTLSTVDVISAIEAFLTLIPRHLTKGETVELGDFGNAFWLRFSAEGVDTPDQVRGDLTQVDPAFYAGG